MSNFSNAQRKLLNVPISTISTIHVPLGSQHRPAAETFVNETFASKYNATVNAFAPNLMVLEQNKVIIAATGWRSAQTSTLYLESYLDRPIEKAMAQLAKQPIQRRHIVEVGHLASQKAGGSVHIIRALAKHLSSEGFEWVVFTATQELIRIFSKLGLPLLAIATADPARLRDGANQWGSYYETLPIVVAGRIRIGMQRLEQYA